MGERLKRRGRGAGVNTPLALPLPSALSVCTTSLPAGLRVFSGCVDFDVDFRLTRTWVGIVPVKSPSLTLITVSPVEPSKRVSSIQPQTVPIELPVVTCQP